MTGAYTAQQRRALEEELAAGAAAQCPVCSVALSTRQVDAPTQVSYVRHRVWVICPQCRRSASLDVKPAR